MNDTGTVPPGAARERTSLAWRRTALAFAVNALLLLRSSEPWLQVGAFAGLAVATGLAAASAASFRNSETRGWFAARRYRAEALAMLAALFGCLDVFAILG